MTTPITNMQLLVSHWATIMAPVSNPRKRSRPSNHEVQRFTKPRTQDAGQSVSTDGHGYGIPANIATCPTVPPEK
jgi:hypothetical protein